MKKLMLLSLLGASFLLQAEVTVRDSKDKIVLENDMISAEISARGGKITGFMNKVTGETLVPFGSTSGYNGLAKARELQNQPLGLFAGRYRLSVLKREKDSVSVMAKYVIASGALKGVELERTFTLNDHTPAIRVEELYRCRQKPCKLSVNWHSQLFCAKNSSLLITSGTSGAEIGKIRANQNNYLPSGKFIASLDRESGKGFILAVDQPSSVETLYSWADDSTYSLEANFRDVSLRPVAAADEWKVSGFLAPFMGKGNVIAVNSDMVLSVDKDTAGQRKAHLFFLKDGDKGALKAGDNVVSAKPAAGKMSEIALPSGSCELVLTTSAREFKFAVPAECSAEKLSAPSTVLMKRNAQTGIVGYYYYYPEYYVTDEMENEIGFGIRGNFTKKQNFRLILETPKGVEFTFCSRKIRKTGENRYEVNPFRKSDYHMDCESKFRIGKEFVSGSTLKFYAVWDGGQQAPEKVILKKLPPFPALKPLKKITFAIGGSSTAMGFTVNNYSKAGINFFEFWEYLPKIMLSEHRGDGAYSRQISLVEKEGMTASLELGTPFVRPHDIARGVFVTDTGTIHHPVRSVEPIRPAEIRAMDSEGKLLSMPCPSCRGRYFAKTLDNVKTSIDYGFNTLSYDDETWGGGTALCFCPRCKKLFQEFLAEKHPDLVGLDPAKPVSDRKKSEALEAAWWDFKTGQVADMYKEIRHVMDTYRPEKGKKRKMTVWLDASVRVAPVYGAITSRLTDYRKIGAYADAVVPMLYTDDSLAVGRLAATASALVKGCRAELWMGLCPNRYYEYFRVESESYSAPGSVEAQALESIFNGAKGVFIWSHTGCFRGMMGFYSLANAAKQLQSVEEILCSGEKVDFPVEEKDVAVTAWKYKDEYAVFLRNYDTETVRLRFIPPAGCTAVDCLTDKPVTEQLTFGKRRVYVLKLRK